MVKLITLLTKKGSRVMRIIGEIPPTPDEYKTKQQVYLRPHVFIEDPPIKEPDSLTNDERPDLNDSDDQ